jgi:hypothetical protein
MTMLLGAGPARSLRQVGIVFQPARERMGTAFGLDGNRGQAEAGGGDGAGEAWQCSARASIGSASVDPSTTVARVLPSSRQMWLASRNAFAAGAHTEQVPARNLA